MNELINYIQKQLNQGTSKRKIKASLKKVGWKKDMIDRAFDQVEKKSRINNLPSNLAGFWIRACAFIIDIVIAHIILPIISVPIGLIFYWFNIEINPDYYLIIDGIYLIVYFIIFSYILSSTPGKLVFGLKIVNQKNKAPINFFKAIIRSCSYLISILSLGWGLFRIGREHKKGLHDTIARTYVTRKKKNLKPGIALTIFIILFLGTLISFNILYLLDPFQELPKDSQDTLNQLDEFLNDKPSEFQDKLEKSKDNKDGKIYEIQTNLDGEFRLIEEIADANKEAVVLIYTDDMAMGSGFIIHPDGVIVTNYHVVKDAKKIAVSFRKKGREEPLEYLVEEVIDYDKDKDIAIIKIDANKLESVTIADPSLVLEPGMPAIAIGNPVGFQNTVSKGIVSSLRDFDGVKHVQVDTPISEGSSGSPIFNDKGEVIGISAFVTRFGQNLNFAISIQEIFEMENERVRLVE